MNFADPKIVKVAKRVCTPQELTALELQHRGLSQHNIAIALDIGRWAVRERLNNGWRKIEREIRREVTNEPMASRRPPAKSRSGKATRGHLDRDGRDAA